LDDITLRLPPDFNDAACAQVREVTRRLAAGGLKIRLDKCLAVAPRGQQFSAEARRLLGELKIPFVDASLPPKARGFTIVGVPIGEDAYVEGHLRGHLFDETLWRLGWQLAGMARADFPAALRIFRGSFNARFMYLARNVDPEVGAPWFGGFDGLSAWVLDRILHLDGAATAANMKVFLQQACGDGDAHKAANGGPLVLPTLGPEGIRGTWRTPGLPLRVARLPLRVGGLAMPQLHLVCKAAFVGQLMTTLRARVVAIHADLQLDRVAAIDPAAELPSPLLQAMHGALRYWTALFEERAPKPVAVAESQRTQRDDDGDVLMRAAGDNGNDSEPEGEGDGGGGQLQPAAWAPPAALAKAVPTPLLVWAKQDAPPTEHSALAAIARAATSSPSKISCEKRLCEAGILPALEWCQGDSSNGKADGQAPAERPPPVQKTLTDMLVEAQLDGLDKDLRCSGAAGKLVRAQLRSQRGPGAMAWLSAQPDRISPVSAVIRLLVAVMVDPYRVGGATCPFGADCVGGPTCVHAIGCHRQHLRGHNATHTQQKRTLQRLLLQFNAGWLSNEDASIFTVAGSRMDTVVAPGALSLACQEEFTLKGVMLDTTVRAPTMAKYMTPPKGAADVSGYAAQHGEKEKLKKYTGKFDTDRWILVPFVQESYGRFGKAAQNFVGILASHSAACRGGNEQVIKRRTGIIYRHIVAELSLSLVREIGERVLQYVRGAIMAGRTTDPVSALLRR
jgi:hypothetical protein